VTIKRPADPETVKRWLLAKAKKLADPRPPSPAQVGLLAGLLNGIFLPEEPTATDKEIANNARHGILRYVFGAASLKDPAMTRSEIGALFAWLEVTKHSLTDDYYIGSPYTIAETKAIYQAFLEAEGQRRLPWVEEV